MVVGWADDSLTAPIKNNTGNVVDQLDWGNWAGNLVQSSQGDALDIWHSTQTTYAPGVTLSYVTDTAHYTTLDMAASSSGGTYPVAVATKNLGRTRNANIVFPITKWQAAYPQSDWPANGPFGAVSVSDVPNTPAFGVGAVATDDLAAANFDPSVTTDQTLSFSYGNPGLLRNEVIVGSGAITPKVVAENGDPSFPTGFTLLSASVRPSPMTGATGSQDPLITPAQNVKVEGQPLSTNVFNISTLTPTVTWQAPAIGTPDHYIVTFRGLTLTNGRGTKFTKVASFWTSGTSVTVPSGYLNANTQYVVIITAALAGQSGFAQHITAAFKTGPPVATACGNLNDPCCTVSSWNTCNRGFTCSAGICQACGAAGQACCFTNSGQQCSDPAAGCDGTNCVPCGVPGGPYCGYDSCSGGGCEILGHCDASGTMESGLTCTNGSFDGPCGADGQNCCTASSVGDSGCTTANETCGPAGKCVHCGLLGEECCGGATDQVCTDGSECDPALPNTRCVP
jgi:hypothetical protein